ncbi:MAG: hypothetical protein WC516_06115 [Patescibacteria group bacterium]|jgi:hypothetical protein
MDKFVKSVWRGYFQVFFPQSLKHTTSCVYGYQECARIYLDEYEGQEKLREEFFAKIEAKKYGCTIDYIKWINSNKSSIEILDKVVNDFVYFEFDQIFYNKWLVKK